MTFAKIPVGTAIGQAQEIKDWAVARLHSGECDELEAKEMLQEWIQHADGLLRLCEMTESGHIYMDLDDCKLLFEAIDL